MKLVIIIALAFVLFVPISVYGGSYDGVYNYYYQFRGPGGMEQHSIPEGFVVTNNRIGSSPSGYFSGSVSSSGNVQFQGPCPQGGLTASFSGRLSTGGTGGGSYDCGRGITGNWDVQRIGGPPSGDNQLKPEPGPNTKEPQIEKDAKDTYDLLVESLKDCDFTNAKSVAQRLYDYGAQIDDLGSIQKGQFIMSQAEIAWDAIIKLEKGIPTAIEDRYGDRINLSCQEGDQFGNIQRGISNTSDLIGWAIFVIVVLGALGGVVYTYKFVRSRF